MIMLFIGAILILAGVVWAAFAIIGGGRMSDTRSRSPSGRPYTLEPAVKDRRLNFRADIPPLLLILSGILVLMAGSTD